jgi:hypothetical protein
MMKSKILLVGIVGALIFGFTFIGCDNSTNGETNDDGRIRSDEQLNALFGGASRPKLKLLTIGGALVVSPPVIELAHWNYGYFWRYGVSNNDARARIDYTVWENAIQQNWHDGTKYSGEKRDGQFVIHHGDVEYVYEQVYSTETISSGRNTNLVGTWKGTWNGNQVTLIFENTGKFRYSDQGYSEGSSWDGAWESNTDSGTTGTVSTSLATIYPIPYSNANTNANDFPNATFSITTPNGVTTLTVFESDFIKQP